MKIRLFLVSLILCGGFAATTSDAQPSNAVARNVAKPAPTHPLATPPAARRGTIGGPVNKGPGINGSAIRTKH